MPLATVHLISLNETNSLPSFLQTLKSTSPPPLVISRVIRWIIVPETIEVDALLQPSKPWDLLVITASTSALPSTITSQLHCHWSTTVGIPSRLTSGFASTNATLLHPPAAAVPALTGSLASPLLGPSAQTLELSTDLQSWISDFSTTRPGRHAVSMLNLLAFRPGQKSEYLVYGKAFAESIGAKRGGNAKLVGNVVHPPSDSAQDSAQDVVRWDEFALAHYPSILHFADMLASRDYQDVNLKHRVPSLRDTCILCTSEIDVEDMLAAEPARQQTERERQSKL